MDFVDIAEEAENTTIIKVIGVGGGGSNAVQNMIEASLKGVTLIAANTDVQALRRSTADYTIQLGGSMTKGLGAGADPTVGREAALESIEAIKEIIGTADMVFVTAGMGGGTGTGAAPIIAQAAREAGALTVGVVTKPFFFEGRKRLEAAEKGIQEFRQCVDSLITIPNDRLISLAPKRAPFRDMLKKADEVLYYAVKGISDLITLSGIINLDFHDVKRIMGESGLAMMGTGVASGEARAREAAMRAITSPLLEDVSMDGARSVLYNITSGPDVTLDEVSEAAAIIQEAAHPDATIIFGAVFDENAGDELSITVIATGIEPSVNGFSGGASNVTGFPRPAAGQGNPAPSPAPTGQGSQATGHENGQKVEPTMPQTGHAGEQQYGQTGGQPAQTQPYETTPQINVTPIGVAPRPAQNPNYGVNPHVSPLPNQISHDRVPQPNPYAGGTYNPNGSYGGMTIDDLNVPTCLRTAGVAQNMRNSQGHVPGGDDFIFDEDEIELPTLVRRQAD
ncbi:MAG: cell division protein FtsZ [Pseudomonadota bacterium]